MNEEALRQRIAAASLSSEDALFHTLRAALPLDDLQWQKIKQNSTEFIASLRSNNKPPLIDQFLTEYGLSNDEGVQLMRLAEALSRTTDPETADELIRDKIMGRDWLSHTGPGHSLPMSLAGRALHFADRWLNATRQKRNPIAAAGNLVLRQATRFAVRMLSSQFVFAETLDQALQRADRYSKKGYLFSFDMLGEAARTAIDATNYYRAYSNALDQVAAHAQSHDARKNNGISIKLSALHPRYGYEQAQQVVPELVDLLLPLAVKAKASNIQITIDAEEAERLDISMDVLAALVEKPELEGWHGLGFVVQAYQRRALPLLDWLSIQSGKLGAPLMIRLVKGAYWDSEIKRAQEMGLSSYPVYTRKEMTDLSYLACAAQLLSKPEAFSPQFATHNANSIAAVQQMAGQRMDFEFQRLFGMGQQLHDMILDQGNVQSRVYAPVGTKKDLLSYLIRRLLENGANSSFVHKLVDPYTDIRALTATPLQALIGFEKKHNDKIPSPRQYLKDGRQAAMGWDLSNPIERERFEKGLAAAKAASYEAFPIINGEECLAKTMSIQNPARLDDVVGQWSPATTRQVVEAIESADFALKKWQSRSANDRAIILERAADLLEARADIFHGLAIREAGKSWSDAIDEVREAVDFCRYYAAQARDRSFENRQALGVIVCISPWNFPLAIFMGQITAALAAGNTVVAKPAEQTPLIAAESIKLLHEAGVDAAALQFIPGYGAVVGETLVKHPTTAGVCFTGSTATAKRIATSLADAGRALTPLIAETGGINAMIIDSSALLEQTVDAVISSAFQSAGQRCSALRILCIQDDIADDFIQLLSGAMEALRIGDPVKLETDIGPVIDTAARTNIQDHINRLNHSARLIQQTPGKDIDQGHFVYPVAYELTEFSDLDREIFGPVLHVVRFPAAEKKDLISKICQRGYGLTLGIQSRIDSVSDQMADSADVGNIYINRNQIGAVVGVQPFGGHGLSGTGPKAGGPLYLRRLSKSNGEPIISDEVAIGDQSAFSVSSLATVCDHLAGIHKQQMSWFDRTDKAEALSAATESMPADWKALLASEILRCKEALPSSEWLASPAGETNLYQMRGRGVILSLLSDPKEIAQGCLRSLITGNIFVQIDKDANKPLDLLPTNLTDYDDIANLIGQFSLTEPDIAANIKQGSFDALLVSPQDPKIGVWGKMLAEKEGAIIPMLIPSDLADRYVHEKTITRNIAAAGGDVSLLNA
ncbi:bifunctional proline dehydrogenase/L-glutamate gamma-semialdehyde dehydrogenase PutA [Parasphingorhabdus sp.]|uniref:bifunctional proline dehydrogenase/L-glutamate gamma-semialdehyde dehydrogenase PutA n=1 Tax=Parasphingorhabdus sp. TaxID=2709688 RepID=UPI0032630EFF